MSRPSPAVRRALRWLSSSSAPRIACGVGLAITIPALFTGWFNDDLTQQFMLEMGRDAIGYGPWQLYDFIPSGHALDALMRDGHAPWWTEPGFSMRFFRPLSSLSIALDHALFGQNATLAHLQSMLWLGVAFTAAAGVFLRVLRPAEAAVATFLYAVAGAHAMGSAWVSARHSVMGGALAVTYLWLYLRGREATGIVERAAMPTLALFLALLASETAVGAVAFAVAYEVVVARDALRVRAASLAPTVSLAVGHLVFYGMAGFGARGSAAYLSPFGDPFQFAQVALRRVPVLMAEAYGALPSLMWGSLRPDGQLFLAAWGLGAAALVFGMLAWVRGRVRGRERRHHLWFGLASVAAMFPMAGGFLGGRLLIVAHLGSAALLAVVLVQGTIQWLAITGLGRWLALVGLLVLGLLHGVFSPFVRLALPQAFKTFSVAERDIGERTDLSGCADGAPVYLVSGGGPELWVYFVPALHYYQHQRAARLGPMRVISAAPQEQRLTRTSPDAFELFTVGPRQHNVFENLYRLADFEVGERIHVGELTIEILGAEGHAQWTAARFEVEGGADRVCIARWDGTGVRIGPLPPVGESLSLAFHPGIRP